MLTFEEAKARLETAGQSHVLQFWAELCAEERDTILEEISQLQPEELLEHCRAATAAASRHSSADDRLDERMEPVPLEFIGSVRKSDKETLQMWSDEGLLQISRGRVAVLLLAGGQGTRLGVSYPKGMYNVGLPSGKTLYQLQAERIRKVQELAKVKHGCKCTVPWYIMTSEFTLGPTENFFKDNEYFGLCPSNVVMFEQRMIPAVGFDGKIILEKKNKIAMAPDGNGGLYRALVDNKILEDMERRGVEYLHVYCVDNILVKLADPVFIGFCVKKGADCGAKVVDKAILQSLLEWYVVWMEVAEKFECQLKQHVAIKKVPFVDGEGNLVKPTKPNGIKMEKFVFDVFKFSKKFVAFEVLREEEFSPLKNADGAPLDTPTTARRSLLAQHYRWALAAGASFQDEQDKPIPSKHSMAQNEDPPAICEISPLVSYFGEGLEHFLEQKNLNSPFLLDENEAKNLVVSLQSPDFTEITLIC
ncbi:UDP-N-acetylhexosamine pyrophosphorylase isoform a [Pimephales promelas]|nr:UDP-N-acetylhexosamine pyrophosphorylase isoform a [Pimephales promelas]